MKIKGLEKIYIIHYAKLKDRREYLKNKIKEMKISDIVEWEIAPENEVLTKEDYSKYDGSKEAREERFRVLGNIIKNKYYQLNKSEIAVTLQHLRVLKKISKSKSKNAFMVLEDDALFEEDFLELLKNLLTKLNKISWDICYTDKGGKFYQEDKKYSNKRISIKKIEIFGQNPTGSYFINKESANKIIKKIKRFSLPIDSELAYLEKNNLYKVFESNFPLTLQGTIEGNYNSNIRKISKTLFLKKIIKMLEKRFPRIAKNIGIFLDKIRNNLNRKENKKLHERK